LTDPSYTHLQLVVDRSGSMFSIAEDMEGAVRNLLADQKALPGKLTVGFVRFDDVVEETAVMVSPDDVDPTLDPRNMTALYDAVGTTITKLGARLAALPEAERPGTVVFAIVTDGLENASKDYDAATVKRLITQQAEQYGWRFVYLGANQDAILVGESLGLSRGSTLSYDPDNVAVAAASLSGYTSTTRSKGVATFSDEDRKAAKRG
jgi:hypothetical protein